MASYLNILEKGAVTTSDELLAVVEDVNKKLGILQEDDDRDILVYREVFTPIIQKRGNISIDGLTYERAKTGVISVRVTGVSPNREALLEFIKSLEAERLFVAVDAPVSNFVKVRDIEFSLDIELKK